MEYRLKIPADMRLIVQSETRRIDGKIVTIIDDNDLVTVIQTINENRPNYFHHVKRAWLEEIDDESPFEKWHSGWQIPSIELRGDRNYLIPIIPEKIKLQRRQGWNGALEATLDKEEKGMDEGGISVSGYVKVSEIEKLREL